MKNSTLFELLVVIATIAAGLLVSRWLYTTVMASDLPNWLKYFILR